MIEVRDPIHSAIRLTKDELSLVENPFVQRLRNILQTGFSYLPFPGATHSRYSHCLGVMHLAGHAFDSVFETYSFSSEEVRASYRQAVRLAALTHDIGHSPFSHSTEFAMPPLVELGLKWYPKTAAGVRATHEDYTVAIIASDSVAGLINNGFNCTARHVASLISQDVQVDDDFFIDCGLDYRPILSQIISSELDVDRLDYLVRDSYYSGARYGTVDVPWLISNLRPIVHDGFVGLGLDHSAIYAFDDFMIARHHMFLMVYFHHKSVVYEELLKRHVRSPESGWSIPADLDEYLLVDDVSLEMHLRNSPTKWASMITRHQPFRRVLERHGDPSEVDLSREDAILREAGLEVIYSGSTGKLSRYNIFGQKRERASGIHVVTEKGRGEAEITELAGVTSVFQRYSEARRIARLYVAPESVEHAKDILNEVK